MAIMLNAPIRNKIIDSGIVGYLGTNAVLKVYDGTQAASAGAAASGNLLVTISGISWGTAEGGTATITTSKNGTASFTGTAAWARLSDSSGTNYIVDGNAGTAASKNFIISDVVITSGNVVTLTSATFVQPAS